MNARPTTPAVSVIIPAYNCAGTIAETLRSVASQTITDIEIIVVDDGSRDTTRDVVSSLARNDSRVVLVSQSNAGASAARNRGVRMAKAAVVAFVDGDDLWVPHHLATHLARFEATPHLGVSFSAARYIDPKGNVTGGSRVTPGRVKAADILYSNPTTTCSTLVVRRRVFDCCGVFDEALDRSEDQEWLFRVATSAWKIDGAAEALVDYRMSPGGLASDLERMRLGYEKMLDSAHRIAPALVEQHQRAARASEDLYLARRALQLTQGQRAAAHYLWRALKSSPEIAWQRPRAVAAILVHMIRPRRKAEPSVVSPTVQHEA